MLAPGFRKNYPVKRPGEITERCFGGDGLQEIDSDLLPTGENCVLTAFVVQSSVICLYPRDLQFAGD